MDEIDDVEIDEVRFAAENEGQNEGFDEDFPIIKILFLNRVKVLVFWRALRVGLNFSRVILWKILIMLRIHRKILRARVGFSRRIVPWVIFSIFSRRRRG
jgi:hypothetical protein